MLTRGSFLKRSLAVVAGICGLKGLETPAVAPRSVWYKTSLPEGTSMIVSTGGLCAPLTPYYDMPAISIRPIRDALPTFAAKRDGISTDPSSA